MIGDDIPNKERRVLADNLLTLFDINPRNWLKPFQRKNFFYLLKMGLFYHSLGLVLMFLGSNLIEEIFTEYESPQIPVSILLAISAGFFEETIFFGIPFYLSGNPLIILGTGIIWSLAHLFNTGIISIQNLAYAGFLFSIPHIFFSLRTWISGKGWFAILFHSGWNLLFLIFYCSIGLRQCNIINENFDIINLLMGSASIMIVYFAYANNKKKHHFNRFLYLIPVGILLIGLMLLVTDEIKNLN